MLNLTSHNDYTGGVEVHFKAFLISALDECEWLTTAILLLLLSEEEAGLNGGSEEKNLCPCQESNPVAHL